MANVMVSEDGDVAEVRLIDLDNLRSASDQSLSVLTPGWAAPEIFEQKPPSRYSDAYSLALVTFNVLTGYHPFRDGDLVRNAGEHSPEAIAAARGHLPSFIDPDDTSNSTANYLFPLDISITSTLLGAFQQAFGSGRHQIEARPTAGSLRRMFWEAHDLTVSCNCRFTTYLDRGACAACEKSFDEVFTLEVLANPSSLPASTIAIGANPVAVQRRNLPLPAEPRKRYDDVVQVSLQHGSVVLNPAPQWSCRSRTLQHDERTEIISDDGISITLRAVAYAG
jgi:serine/threonine protein kinase